MDTDTTGSDTTAKVTIGQGSTVTDTTGSDTTAGDTKES